ncbi:trimethylamine methyltransferase [Desulfosarcina alkanivorans]|uniref:Methyltransferase n=1 Tax=Desulfosarcina alkanivorans TaxID=571177 RepID=A0A5K7Z169_9BACT|nr:trimethylamine methyltransferase family protein [Desulfosarcina alkanivorans]BBO70547.1 trimethylamine methyltransferase [Desulfosarcina alkanivorans]
MYDRMQTFTTAQMTRVHDASMELLSDVGVAFNEPEALEIFAANGFRIDGKTVFMTEAQVRKALETAPSRFMVTARNPEKSVAVGEDDFVFVPGYGAPFIALPDGGQREATMTDYDNFCKLVQTSTSIDMNGFMMIEPGDVSPETAHLDMMFSSIVLCDKPFMGSPVSRQGARDCIEMASILWGGPDKLAAAGPVCVSLINSLSPLQFSDEMAGSLIELARANQACVIASLIMAGSSGPVTLSGVLALQNAEILAGITLAQLVNPGTPVIYGSTSSAMDMRTGGLAIGCPELSMVVSATAQMARFYKLPSRSGGGLTDAHFPDGQAAGESALALSTAARSGVNFILHSAGILGAYIAMSYEKFLMDEEMCSIIRKLIQPMDCSEAAIDVEMIKAVGIGGQYLTQPKTFQLCRTEFYMTDFFNRQNHAGWKAAGAKRIDQAATEKLSQRLAAYEKPPIDLDVETALSAYIAKRKNNP